MWSHELHLAVTELVPVMPVRLVKRFFFEKKHAREICFKLVTTM